MANLFQATVTAKGQITIPKAIRERLGIGRVGKVAFEALPGQKSVLMRSVVDFLDVSEQVSTALKRKKKINPTKARG